MHVAISYPIIEKISRQNLVVLYESNFEMPGFQVVDKYDSPQITFIFLYANYHDFLANKAEYISR